MRDLRIATKYVYITGRIKCQTMPDFVIADFVRSGCVYSLHFRDSIFLFAPWEPKAAMAAQRTTNSYEKADWIASRADFFMAFHPVAVSFCVLLNHRNRKPLSFPCRHKFLFVFSYFWIHVFVSVCKFNSEIVCARAQGSLLPFVNRIILFKFFQNILLLVRLFWFYSVIVASLWTYLSVIRLRGERLQFFVCRLRSVNFVELHLEFNWNGKWEKIPQFCVAFGIQYTHTHTHRRRYSNDMAKMILRSWYGTYMRSHVWCVERLNYAVWSRALNDRNGYATRWERIVFCAFLFWRCDGCGLHIFHATTEKTLKHTTQPRTLISRVRLKRFVSWHWMDYH